MHRKRNLAVAHAVRGKLAANYRLASLCSPQKAIFGAAESRPVASSSPRGLLREFETDFAVFQFQVSGKRASAF